MEIRTLAFLGKDGIDYGVGDDGSTWSRKLGRGLYKTKEWRRKSQTRNKDGYLRVTLVLNGKPTALLTHQLVLKAFVGPCPAGYETCHNDGDLDNNHVSNLRWDTHGNNVRDQLRHGTMQARKKQDNVGEKHPMSRHTDDEIRELLRLWRTGKFKKVQLAKMFSMTSGMVWMIVNRRNWTHLE